MCFNFWFCFVSCITIASSAVRLKLCAITAGIKTFKSVVNVPRYLSSMVPQRPHSVFYATRLQFTEG